MQILCKKSFLFVSDPTAPGRKEHVVHPSGNIQYAPDWIVDDPTFDLAVKDGDVIEVEVKSPEPEPKVKGGKKADTGLSGDSK